MTTTLLTTASIFFHTMATIMLIGHYLLMTVIYLPVFKRRFDGKALLGFMAEVNNAVRRRIYAALGMFGVTGIYLMLINKSYLGVGQFGNAWSILMLVKHILILAMIGLIIMINSTIRTGMAKDNEGALARLDILLRAISASGILVLLLTAFAQA